MSDLDHTYCSRCWASTEKPEMHNDDKCANNLRKNNDDPRLELKEKDSRIDEYLNLSVELKAANKRANALIGNQAEENGKIVAELKAEVTKLRDALEKK